MSGSEDNTIRLWNADTGKEVRVLYGHHSKVGSVAFSPDGQRIISGSIDSTTRLWDLATGKEILRMVNFNDGEWIAITPEGFFEASSPKAAQHLNVRLGNRVYGIDQFYNQFYRPDLVALALAGDKEGAVRLAAKRANMGIIIGAGAPPVVSIVSPAAGRSSRRDVEVVAALEEQDGGIGKVEWKLNGMTVGVMEPGRGIA
ncbi:MAG: hypothetical protein D6698_10060, partial [Gammaproteobacteria bacterium]